MTTVTQLITTAYRQSNLIARGTTPTTAELDEALYYLNNIVLSVLGNEAGEPLTPFPIGDKNLTHPAGYPGYDDVPDAEWFVPKNTRLMFNLNNAVDIYLHPAPNDGTRFGIQDVSGNLNAYNVTIYGNGANIEGAPTAVLNVDGLSREWFYRADTGNWARVSPLVLADEFPFPPEFDMYFTGLLALALNPTNGIAMDAQTQSMFNRSKSQFSARYVQTIAMPSELALLRLTKMAADRDRWANEYTYYNPDVMFDRGWPF